MFRFILFFSYLLTSVLAASSKEQFIAGFETGIVLKDKPELIRTQYKCPQPEPEGNLERLQEILPTMKMMVLMVPD